MSFVFRQFQPLYVSDCEPQLSEADVKQIIVKTILSLSKCKFNMWSSWGHCSVTCGKGIIFRTRTVSQQAIIRIGNRQCKDENEITYCNEDKCPYGM